jgi:hypothetical protein
MLMMSILLMTMVNTLKYVDRPNMMCAAGAALAMRSKNLSRLEERN